MIHLRHRTASGRASELWEYDSARRVLEIVLRLGSAQPLAFTIGVCAPDCPRLFAHPILRIDSECWRVLPAMFARVRYIAEPRFEPRECRPARGDTTSLCDLHNAIGYGAQILLTNTPPEVEVDLMELSA